MTIRVQISAKILWHLVMVAKGQWVRDDREIKELGEPELDNEEAWDVLNDLTCGNDLLAEAIAIADDKLLDADRRRHVEAIASEPRVLELAGLIGRADFPWPASWPESVEEWERRGCLSEDWAGKSRELVLFAAERAGKPNPPTARGYGRLGLLLFGLSRPGVEEEEEEAAEVLTALGVSDGRDDDGVFLPTGAAWRCGLGDPPLSGFRFSD